VNIKSISLKNTTQNRNNFKQVKNADVHIQGTPHEFQERTEERQLEAAAPSRAGVSQGFAMVYEESRSDIKRNARE